ncbi:MAG: hypothetical protein PHE83_16725 [Opitutaceae bacterium]|nr:hypothetical protein [Opitutaceae bacterium]
MAHKKRDTPLSPDAKAALRAAEFTGRSFRLTRENLACYPEIKALVITLGGRWNKHTGQHDFPAGVDAQALIRAACDRGVIPATNPLDYYSTPPDIVKRMLGHDWFRLRADARTVCAEMDGRPRRMLEPSAGLGGIARELALLGGELTCVEINPVSAGALRQSLPQATVFEGDFLDFTPADRFDLIVMNPPFAGTLWRKHLMHAFGMLDRLGILAAIAPGGFLKGGSADLEFMRFINLHGEIERLPAGSFPEVKLDTCIIYLENDPSGNWLDREHEGFSTGHAWEIHTSLNSDGDRLREIRLCRDFHGFLEILHRFELKANFEYNIPVRVDERIAAEVLEELMAQTPECVSEELRTARPAPEPGQAELKLVA